MEEKGPKGKLRLFQTQHKNQTFFNYANDIKYTIV